MFLPKFLIADNDDYPENTYVIHTESPSFIVDVDTEEYKILENSEVDEDSLSNLLKEAFEFYEDELDKYEEDED